MDMHCTLCTLPTVRRWVGWAPAGMGYWSECPRRLDAEIFFGLVNRMGARLAVLNPQGAWNTARLYGVRMLFYFCITTINNPGHRITWRFHTLSV